MAYGQILEQTPNALKQIAKTKITYQLKNDTNSHLVPVQFSYPTPKPLFLKYGILVEVLPGEKPPENLNNTRLFTALGDYISLNGSDSFFCLKTSLYYNYAFPQKENRFFYAESNFFTQTVNNDKILSIAFPRSYNINFKSNILNITANNISTYLSFQQEETVSENYSLDFNVTIFGQNYYTMWE